MRTDTDLMTENFKRSRGDRTSTSSNKFPHNIDHKNLKQFQPFNKNISHSNISQTQPTNITQSIIKNAYNENRLKSMSHIKQINPKYRNYVIPVLPGAFNKFSNI